MSVFALLHSRIQNVLELHGIKEPTEPQTIAIPKILAGKHVLIIAPTGIGKTEAAVLPIFHRLLLERSEGLSVLYITPLRALNRDMLKRLNIYSVELGLKIAVRHGDTPPRERARLSRTPPDMLITTPETVQLLLLGKNLRRGLRNVKWVIIDEIHELAGSERGAQLMVALERLQDLSAVEFQRIGLSATVGSPEEIAKFLVGTRQIDIVRFSATKSLELVVSYAEPDKDDEILANRTYTELGQTAALRLCRKHIESHHSTLLFVNTRDTAEFLTNKFKLWDENFPVGIHHGSLSRDMRIQMEDEFKAEKLKALICTSSLELGIDIGHVDFALQFNSPRQVTRLMQRFGRAGHKFGEVSRGTIIATLNDEIAESAVIARRALAEKLEPIRIRFNPYSVLVNQLVAMLIADGPLPLYEPLRTITRAYPFHNLSREAYLRIIQLLNDLKLIVLRDEMLRKGAAAIQYFYENISMIPDEKSFRIIDITTRRWLGTVDETYAIDLQPETKFIIGGMPWKVVEREEERIIVQPVNEAGKIPSWAGTELPVSFEVAQEVGRLRRTMNFSDYPLDAEAQKKLHKYIDMQAKNNPVPTDEHVTLETDHRLAIINCAFGTKVNQTLGQLVALLLSARTGESVTVQTDPYRIILETAEKIDAEKIRQILFHTEPAHVFELMKKLIRNTTRFRRQFLYTLKKFGSVRRDADYRQINFQKFIDIFENTPLLEEAVAKTFHDEYDIEKTAEVLQRLQSGMLKFELTKLSPMGLEGYENRGTLVQPARMDKAILSALKQRLEKELMIQICMNCGSRCRITVETIAEKIVCRCCGAALVSVIPQDKETEALKVLRTKKPEREFKRLLKCANLVLAYQRDAVLVLAGRGIGPDTAARILMKLHNTEEELLRDILAAELNYARTRQFWAEK